MSTMTELKEQIKDAQAEMKRIRAETTKKMQTIFSETTKQLFDEHPKLQSFSWSQYTPHFNDGETCVFSVNFDYGVRINDIDEDETPDDENTISEDIWDNTLRKSVPNPNYDLELGAAKEAVLKFLNVFDEEYFLDTFGDHVRVVVTKRGVSTEDYDHD